MLKGVGQTTSANPGALRIERSQLHAWISTDRAMDCTFAQHHARASLADGVDRTSFGRRVRSTPSERSSRSAGKYGGCPRMPYLSGSIAVRSRVRETATQLTRKVSSVPTTSSTRLAGQRRWT